MTGHDGTAGQNRLAGHDDGLDEHVRVRLGDLASAPVAKHPAVYEQVHRVLAQALDDLDGG